MDARKGYKSVLSFRDGVAEELMKKGSLLVSALVLTSMFLVCLTVFPEARAVTHYVGGGGPGNYTMIQAAIDDSNPGDAIYVYNGTYIESVEVHKPLTMTGENKDTTVVNANGIRSALNISSNWVNVSGFGFTGGGHFSAYGAGITLYNVLNCRVVGNSVNQNYKSGIRLVSAHANTITDNFVFDNSFYGILLSYSSGNNVTGNTVSNHDDHGIFLDSSGRNDVVGNILSWNGVGVYLKSSSGNYLASNNASRNHYGGIHVEASSNTTVFNNMAMSNSFNGIMLDYTSDMIVSNNTASSNYRFGLHLWRSSDSIVTGNTASDNEVGISVVSSVNTTIIGNNASLNDRQGILVTSSNTAVEENNVRNNLHGVSTQGSANQIRGNSLSGNQNGIIVGSSDNGEVVNNTVIEGTFGISLSDSDNMLVSNNRVTNCSWKGIQVSRSIANLIVSNILSDNRDGIGISQSSWNTIRGNFVSFSERLGIGVMWSDNNEIYHNELVQNWNQASDNTDMNKWDNDYPSGGNFWSDYTGVDLMRGPYQNIPGSDGIGDTPYMIDIGDVNSYDRYPLISPGRAYAGPPSNVDAILDGKDFENVTVVWNPPPNAVDGTVDRYDVYRGEDFDRDGFSYQYLGSVPNGTSYFVDTLSGEGNPDAHFYTVCAVSTTNTTICAGDQAAKFTRPLVAGPNLVSIPLIQSKESIEAVLQTVEYDMAWFYDSSSQEWKWYMKSKTYRRGLWNVNHTMGIWVNVTQNSNLTVAGVVPAQTTIHLHEGWNLISFPSVNTSFTVADLKASSPVERVEGFDPAPPYFLRVRTDSDVLLAGSAYWVKVQADVVWNVAFE